MATSGIYFEFIIPKGTDTYSENIYVGLSKKTGPSEAPSNPFYIKLYEDSGSNYEIYIYDTIVHEFTGKYNEGDLLSVYFDGTNVSCCLNGSIINAPRSFSNDGSSYRFLCWSDSLFFSRTFNRVKFYPTGLLGPTGPAGPALDTSIDTNLGSRLFVSSDATITGNLYVNGAINPTYNPTSLVSQDNIGHSITISDSSSVTIPIGVWLVNVQIGYYAGISRNYSNTGTYATTMYDDISFNLGSGIVVPSTSPRITNNLPAVAYTDLNVDYNSPVAPMNDPK